MRVVVCIKQVFDPASVRVSSRGELDTREGVLTVNAADLCALEDALKLKDEHQAEVIVLTLGGPQAEDALREALAMGADRAVLLSDRALEGSDAHGVSYALACAIGVIGNVDLVLTGVRSSDDGGGQVGPHIAEMLGLPQITSAYSLSVHGDRATAIQVFEDGARRLSVPLPAVVTIPEQSNRPRLAHVASIMNVYKEGSVEMWGVADISADAGRLGAEGTLTVVRRSFAPEPAVKGDILTGTAKEAAAALAACLRKRGLI
mgnify:CR=1 FL=1